MTAVVITAALFFCNITPLKNAAKDSLPCPDNTNKFILFWVKFNIQMFAADSQLNTQPNGENVCENMHGCQRLDSKALAVSGNK